MAVIGLSSWALAVAFTGSVSMGGAFALPGDTPTPTPIYGGEIAQPCAWPSAVELEGCTGTLVHPELVVFASHCIVYGAAPSKVQFGEDANAPERSVAVAGCDTHPDFEAVAGRDIAFCKLAEPVLDVPIVPIAMGCEAELIEPGIEVVSVGFGESDGGVDDYQKRWVTMDVNRLEGDEIVMGGGGHGTCFGDSGGPSFLRVEDGSWRVFGITSYGLTDSCADEGYYSMIHTGVDWIEEASGLDVTPCHDADGTWNPDERCGAFPMGAAAGDGTWQQGCADPTVSEMSDACGDPFAEGGTTSDGMDSAGDESAGDTDAEPEPEPPEETSAGTTDDPVDPTGGETDDPAADGGSDDGCGCRSRPPTGRVPAGLVLLLLAALGRRRRGDVRR